MNLRFPEVFGIVLFVAFLCSFALPRQVSGRVENTFQFLFAPVTGPIQWMTAGKADTSRADTPILSQHSDEVTRLREEKRALTNYVEILRGQMETLQHRENEAGRIGGELSGKTTTVKVIGVDANGRDILRLAGTSAGIVERDQPVVAATGLVGRVLDVGLGNQSSVRLITDKGFKLLGRFGRYVDVGDGSVQLAMLSPEPTVAVGLGHGAMQIERITMADVQRIGLKHGDLFFLNDARSDEAWPIEVHGTRIGVVGEIKEKLDTPGVADITVTPEAELLKLKEVWIMTRK